MRYLLKYGKKENMDVHLTPSGFRHVQELIDYAKRHNDQLPLKERYAQNRTAQILRNLE